MNIRVIPRLDIKGPNLVKGIHLEGLRVLGKPEDFARKYYLEGADELIYIDIVASLYGRQNLLDIVSRAAKELFVPLTAGGGIRTIEDIAAVLRAGADKVSINTAAVNDPELITRGAKTFGSQCIVVTIEAKKMADGRYQAFTDNAREPTGRDVLEWAREAVERGAGELLVTSIDRDGTGKGYDVGLVREISESVPVPVIASGGAGKLGDFVDVARQGRADAVCAASVFHYNRLSALESDERYKDEGNTEFVRQARGAVAFRKVEPADVVSVKDAFTSAGISCRSDCNEAA